jgi:16S rRNA (adenine1518-N6/adenine1519-N6)-dimethyltransferase
LIVDETLKEPCASILEVGPGKGALSDALARQKNPNQIFWMIEKDPALISDLRFRGHEVLEGDAVQALPALADTLPRPSVFVSNLPYSSGIAILVGALESEAFQKLVVMHQREVIQRLLAPPGSRQRGSLSVWLQTFWQVQSLSKVPPQAFHPPPKVHSETVIVRPRKSHPFTSWLKTKAFKDISLKWSVFLKKGFLYPRKMLRSTFSAALLESVGIDSSRRPQTLTEQEWVDLFEKE